MPIHDDGVYVLMKNIYLWFPWQIFIVWYEMYEVVAGIFHFYSCGNHQFSLSITCRIVCISGATSHFFFCLCNDIEIIIKCHSSLTINFSFSAIVQIFVFFCIQNVMCNRRVNDALRVWWCRWRCSNEKMYN